MWHATRAGDCAHAFLQVRKVATALLTQLGNVSWQLATAAFSLLLHVLRHVFSAARAGVSQDVLAVSQLVAHATPLPAAKQLAKAVSNSALQSTTAAETLQVFFIAVACLMQAVVAGLKAEVFGGLSVVVVAGGEVGVVVVVVGNVPDVAPAAPLASTSAAVASAHP
ncbi:MAG: hypothetical protein E6J79_03610 [Deltaproteobacteria bacterium]|nr:MAG: hypothetical protein E6J79_03610 [Deltaproteobacteria bacterium]